MIKNIIELMKKQKSPPSFSSKAYNIKLKDNEFHLPLNKKTNPSYRDTFFKKLSKSMGRDVKNDYAYSHFKNSHKDSYATPSLRI